MHGAASVDVVVPLHLIQTIKLFHQAHKRDPCDLCTLPNSASGVIRVSETRNTAALAIS